MTLPYASIVFDLDGTLTDSMPFHVRAWAEAFQSVCSFTPSEEEAYSREGEKSPVFAEYVYRKYRNAEPSGDLIDRLFTAYRAELKKIFYIRFFPGAKDLLEWLSNRGVPLGLVSGSDDVRGLLSGSPEVLGRFNTVVSGGDTPVGKPDPAPYLKAFTDLGVDPKLSLVVENAPLGLRAGASSGASCWAVRNNSPLGDVELISAGASKILSDLFALRAGLGVF